MKLANETLTILKNFAEINSGIQIKKGTKLSTISPQKNILAFADVADDFPTTFAIYDLNNFLSVLSLHKDNVELEFDEHHVIFVGRNGKSRIKYRFTDPQMIKTPPEKELKVPGADVAFTLELSDLEWVTNAARVLASPHVAVESAGLDVSLVTFDAAKDDAHREALELNVAHPANFSLVFKTDNFNKLLPDTYEVEISSKGISKFVGPRATYFLALEQKESRYSAKDEG